MLHSVLADLVMLAHFGFVVFVVGGGLLVAWRPAVAWLHVPSALYGAAIELFGWVCPLTPLEVRLRRAAGQAGWEGSFVERYLEGVLYPSNWGEIHLWLAAGVLVVNMGVYGWVLWRRRGRRASTRDG